MGRVSDAKARLMDAVRELIWTGSYGSTTIDQICAKAEVKKGSFYYFFQSKSDLAVAALSEEWEHHRAELDSLFSPTVPPLDRFRKYCDYGYRIQAEMRQKCGFVLGCPIFTLGSEVSTQEAALKNKIQEILDYKRRYFATAIRDAHAAGLIPACDSAAKAQTVFAYMQGLLTQARIEDNLELLKGCVQGIFELLGVKEASMAA